MISAHSAPDVAVVSCEMVCRVVVRGGVNSDEDIVMVGAPAIFRKFGRIPRTFCIFLLRKAVCLLYVLKTRFSEICEGISAIRFFFF